MVFSPQILTLNSYISVFNLSHQNRVVLQYFFGQWHHCHARNLKFSLHIIIVAVIHFHVIELITSGHRICNHGLDFTLSMSTQIRQMVGESHTERHTVREIYC